MKIFKAGTHISASGEQVTVTREDLVQCAAMYDKAKHEAPYVIGHPTDNAPAWAWVDHLEVTENGELISHAVQIDPDFAEIVSNGRFKKVSASFYRPDSAVNPVGGTWYLRHVGVLGAVPPAVKGLGDASFSEGSFTTFEIDFMEAVKAQTEEIKPVFERESVNDFAERQKQLDDREAKIRLVERKLQRDANSFELDKIINSGRPLGNKKDEILTFMDGLDNQTVDFGESKGVKAATWFLSLLQSLPAQVDFSEVSKEIGTQDKSQSDEEIALLARKKAMDEGIRFSEAVDFYWNQRGNK